MNRFFNPIPRAPRTPSPALPLFLLLGTVLLLLSAPWEVGAKEISFTLEDRDRIIRLESKVEEGFRQIDKRFEQIDKRFEQIDKRFEQVDKRFEQIDKRFEQVDKRFEQIDKRIERLENIMMWGFGLLFTSMIALVGFVLWDRRSALQPVIRKNKELEEELTVTRKKTRELEEREARLERMLVAYAEKNPEFAQILKEMKLL